MVWFRDEIKKKPGKYSVFWFLKFNFEQYNIFKIQI